MMLRPQAISSSESDDEDGGDAQGSGSGDGCGDGWGQSHACFARMRTLPMCDESSERAFSSYSLKTPTAELIICIG